MNIIDMNFHPHKSLTHSRTNEYAIFFLRQHISAKTERNKKKKLWNRKNLKVNPFATALRGVFCVAEVAFDGLSKSEPDKKSIGERGMGNGA